jgi:2-polyprenyl-3-methyl-5-hydroxy-6-metoxy-1,4-benzoquinol methylase
MQFPGYIIVNDVYHNDRNPIAQQFEERYLAARTREGRVYDDKTVQQLPEVPPGHKLEREWALRRESAQRLVNYCRKKQPQTILEVGCGNGWLSHMLATAGNEVTGVDVNLQELEQAARVFKRSNLCFLLDEFTSPLFTDQRFDMIVFAASIQYFPSLKDIITLALGKLNPGGELHILDTHFYPQEAVATARQRSVDYYTSLGVPEMAASYFHHSIEELKAFPVKRLYDPESWMNRLKGNRSPFPWLYIKK